MSFKGLPKDQTAPCGKVGNITQTFWVIRCSDKESLSVICLSVWLVRSFSVYLFWSLTYLSTLQIIEKMKHVLWDVLFLRTFAEHWVRSLLLLSVGSFADGNGYKVQASVTQISVSICFIHFPEMECSSFHRAFLVSRYQGKTGWDVVLRSSVQLWGNRGWRKICYEGIMMVAATKLPPVEVHMTGRPWIKLREDA